ncbi:MAG: PIN domain-containing protein [Vicinamibacteria bacterium]
MAVALDADILLLLLNPGAKPPEDPATHKPLERSKDRIEYLVTKLGDSKTRIIIPTPVLSEILIKAGVAGPQYIDVLRQHSQFKIAPFDERSAIECAAQLAGAKSMGDKKAGSTSPWAKVKFDRQIVAIAVVNGVERIYSSDEDIEKYARASGIQITKLWELPLPPVEQPALPHMEPPGAVGESESSPKTDSPDTGNPENGE